MTQQQSDFRPKPLILTLQLDEETDAFFQDLRTRYFPPALNFIPAHLTLFHQLPGEEERQVLEILAKATERAPFPVTIAGLMRLGRGTAYRIDAPSLEVFHRDLAAAFKPWLINQDRQGFRPHVTVQNKVSAAEASGLFDHLSRDFAPFEGLAQGVQLWSYEGGPWSPRGAMAFRGARLEDRHLDER